MRLYLSVLRDVVAAVAGVDVEVMLCYSLDRLAVSSSKVTSERVRLRSARRCRRRPPSLKCGQSVNMFPTRRRAKQGRRLGG